MFIYYHWHQGLRPILKHEFFVLHYGASRVLTSSGCHVPDAATREGQLMHLAERQVMTGGVANLM